MPQRIYSMFDFSDFTKGARVDRITHLREKVRSEVDDFTKEILVKFFTDMAGHARVSQLVYSAILAEVGVISKEEIGTSKSIRYIQILPLKLQGIVSRVNGSYSERALELWKDVVDEDVLRADVITSTGDGIEALRAWGAYNDIKIG